MVGVGRWSLRVQAYAFLLVIDWYLPFPSTPTTFLGRRLHYLLGDSIRTGRPRSQQGNPGELRHTSRIWKFSTFLVLAHRDGGTSGVEGETRLSAKTQKGGS